MAQQSNWHITQNAFDQERERQARAALLNKIDAILAADAFDAIAFDALNTRASYSDIVLHLENAAPTTTNDNITTTLNRRVVHHFLLLRLASEFGLLPAQRSAVIKMFTNDMIRDFAAGDDPKKAAGARTILALIGEPHVEWFALPRDLRAAFCLGRAVRAMHSRTIR